ncbi:hypothetical protein PIB30_112890, partial [Stylosanthes scabra]|nr:hypothetical protein [Stylosanthes scabra]
WSRYLPTSDEKNPRLAQFRLRYLPTAHEPLLRVDDVPDNRRPERRMRVGTRTTARDWQWVNQAMEEDGEVEVAPQRVR